MSADSTPPFKPATGASTTTNIAVTASNQTHTLPTTSQPSGTGVPQQFRFVVDGPSTIFWAWGTVTSATATSTPMLGGTAEVFTAPDGVTTLSVISTTTGTTLYTTAGYGS